MNFPRIWFRRPGECLKVMFSSKISTSELSITDFSCPGRVDDICLNHNSRSIVCFLIKKKKKLHVPDLPTYLENTTDRLCLFAANYSAPVHVSRLCQLAWKLTERMNVKLPALKLWRCTLKSNSVQIYVIYACGIYLQPASTKPADFEWKSSNH